MRAIALDGGGGRGLGGGFGGGRGCLIGTRPVRALAAVRRRARRRRRVRLPSLADDGRPRAPTTPTGPPTAPPTRRRPARGGSAGVRGDDGAVRPWAPGSGALDVPSRRGHGVFLGVRRGAHARRGVSGGGREEQRGRRPRHRRGGQLFRGGRRGAGDAGRRGLGRARGWGPTQARAVPVHPGKPRGAPFAPVANTHRETIAGPRSAGSRAAAFPERRRRGRRARRAVACRGGASRVGARPHAPPPHAPPGARGGPGGGEAGERVPRREPDMRDAAGMGERMTRKLRESEKVLVMCCKIISVLRYFVRAAH